MVRSAHLRVSRTMSPYASILRDAAEFIIGPRFARTRWRLLRMRTGLRPRFQRLLDLDLEHAVDIVRRDRPDHLVENGAFAADHKSLGHAIDAPFDRGAAVAVDADHAERVAVAAEEAAGVVRPPPLVDAAHLPPR